MDVFILERRQLPAGRRCSIRKHEVRQKPEPAPSSSIQIQHYNDDMNIELAFGNWKQQKQNTSELKIKMINKPSLLLFMDSQWIY